MSACLVPWFYGETCDHIYRDCMNRRQDYVGDDWKPTAPMFDAHGTDVCGMCLHRHNRTTHAAHLAAQRPTPACPYRAHYGEPCDCEARLAAVGGTTDARAAPRRPRGR